MTFDHFHAYAHACGRAGINEPDAERIGTLTARLWRHGVNGCNRPISEREKRADVKARSELAGFFIGAEVRAPVNTRIEVDDSALPRVYIVTPSARIWVPVRNP